MGRLSEFIEIAWWLWYKKTRVALWCNWLTRCPLKAESTGSIPVSATNFLKPQHPLLEHLPKRRHHAAWWPTASNPGSSQSLNSFQTVSEEASGRRALYEPGGLRILPACGPAGVADRRCRFNRQNHSSAISFCQGEGRKGGRLLEFRLILTMEPFAKFGSARESSQKPGSALEFFEGR